MQRQLWYPELCARQCSLLGPGLVMPASLSTWSPFSPASKDAGFQGQAGLVPKDPSAGA